jgi:predicted nucleic acid-binding Zn ribbon protein
VKFCGLCGTKVPEGDLFCSSCGHELGQKAAVPAPEPNGTSASETPIAESPSKSGKRPWHKRRATVIPIGIVVTAIVLAVVFVYLGEGAGEGKILFTSDWDGDYEIFVMNAVGGEVQQLTDHPLGDREPAWSPTGNKIAFQSARDGDNWEVFVMNADGTGVTQLTDNDDSDLEPAWSPTGNKIAFQSSRASASSIFVMNADGTGVQQLTDNDYRDWKPMWSPTGKKIAFSSDPDGYFEIFVMNADGSNVVSLGQQGFSRSWGG